MPEPFAATWLVLVGAGGYVLAVVQFFKDFLNVRKLELEIAELRHQVRDRERIIQRATPEEIDRYTRPMARLTPGPGATPFLVVVAAGGLLALMSASYFVVELRQAQEAVYAGVAERDAARDEVRLFRQKLESLQRELDQAQRLLKKREDELRELKPDSSLKSSEARKYDAQPGAPRDAPQAARP